MRFCEDTGDKTLPVRIEHSGSDVHIYVDNVFVAYFSGGAESLRRLIIDSEEERKRLDGLLDIDNKLKVD